MLTQDQTEFKWIFLCKFEHIDHQFRDYLHTLHGSTNASSTPKNMIKKSLSPETLTRDNTKTSAGLRAGFPDLARKNKSGARLPAQLISTAYTVLPEAAVAHRGGWASIEVK